MNERIKELAHEAGLPTYNPEGIPTKLEKFAELIVRECINQCYNVDVHFDSIAWKYIQDCVSRIKEHFGVN